MIFNKEVQKLLLNNKFYVSIKNKNTSKNYWSVKKDPDGILRDRIKNHSIEKKKFIKNNQSLLKTIRNLKSKDLCDVGCGSGYLLSYFKNKKNTYGIDNDFEAIKLASKYAKVFNQDLNNKFNINNKFDLVTCYHVIEHIKKPEILIKNIKSIVKNKKYLIIGTPDFDCFMARQYLNDFRLLHDKTHISLFSLDSLSRLLRQNGFKIINVDYPFLGTEYDTKSNFLKAHKVKKGFSPAFYGNMITILCQKL